MAAVAIRITIGAPLVALALLAFVLAMLIEWIGDLVGTRRHSEKSP